MKLCTSIGYIKHGFLSKLIILKDCVNSFVRTCKHCFVDYVLTAFQRNLKSRPVHVAALVYTDHCQFRLIIGAMFCLVNGVVQHKTSPFIVYLRRRT